MSKARYKIGETLPGGFLIEQIRWDPSDEFVVRCCRCQEVFKTSNHRVKHGTVACPICDVNSRFYQTRETAHPKYELNNASLSNFACAIINAAITDYKLLERTKTRTKYIQHQQEHLKLGTIEEVRRFFQSEWFELLLSVGYPSGRASKLRKILKIPEAKK